MFRKTLYTFIGCAVCLFAWSGCKGNSSGDIPDASTPQNIPIAKSRTRSPLGDGPSLVFIIVDTTASCSKYRSDMAKAAKAALDEYSNDGDVSAVIIDLNDSPNVVMETPPGKSLSENDLDTYFENLKKTKFDGSGTDIISAFELVEAYRSRYSSPSRYAVLCFTDGLIESPHHKVFKTWSGFDWKKLYSDHAEVAFYFVDDEVKQRMVSGRMETAWQQITETMPEQEFPTWKVELASTVIDSLKEGDPYIPASDEGN